MESKIIKIMINELSKEEVKKNKKYNQILIFDYKKASFKIKGKTNKNFKEHCKKQNKYYGLVDIIQIASSIKELENDTK